MFAIYLHLLYTVW